MSSIKVPSVYLVARMCAPSSYDHVKMMRHVNGEVSDFAYADLKGAYRQLHNELIVRKKNFSEVSPFSTSIENHLDHFDKKATVLLLEARTNNLDVFNKFCNLLKERYGNMKIILVMDNPLNYYNSFCHSRNSTARINSSKYYFTHKLFDLDKLFKYIEACVGKENIHVIASNNRRKNEQSVCSLVGVEYDKEIAATPFPQSFKAQEINSYSGLPTWLDIIPFKAWRELIGAWEAGENAGWTRTVASGDFLTLSKAIEGNCGYARMRWPELDAVLEKLDVASFVELPEYAPLDDSDVESFAAVMPVEQRERIRSSFPVLRRGLSDFHEKLLRQIDKKMGIDVGEDLSVPKCAVITFTYNHEKYIEQCLESIAAQEPGCLMEHIVVDDASTDDTPRIIAAYAEKFPHIKPVLFKSKPSNPIYPAFQSCRSQYVALCDGDDYFCNKNKLKKQIDFLDSNLDCALCFHYTEVFFENGRRSYVYPTYDALPSGVQKTYGIGELLKRNIMQTSSVMYRWRFGNGLPDWFRPALSPGDWYWHLLHAEFGRIGFIPEILSRYRRHSNAIYECADRNTALHRVKYGMKELEMYQHCDEHFEMRYHADFLRLSASVFSDFVSIFTTTGNSELIDRAARQYPVFARDYFAGLRKESNVREH